MSAARTTSSARAGSRARSLALITLLYTVAHGLSLFNRGLYWDDWVFWRQDPSVVARAATAMGSLWPSAINRLFYYSQVGITLSRVLSFLAMLAVALLLYDTLRHLPGIDETTALWIAAIFAVFPAYESRIALVMLGYSVSLAFFAAAVWLLVRFAPGPSPAVKVAAAALFLASFQTGSLIVFFAVVPVVLLLADPARSRTLAVVARRLAGYAGLLVLPPAFWLVKWLWLRPSGMYGGYNMPVSRVSHFAHDFGAGLLAAATGPFGKAVNVLPLRGPFVVALVAAFLALLMLRAPRSSRQTRGGALVVAGLALLVLAVLPYAAVGKVLTNAGWDTRHQLLVPFAGAFVIVGLARLLGRARARALGSALLVLAVFSSVQINVTSYIRYERDWLKQKALMQAFSESPKVRSSRFIILDDRTRDLDRTPRIFYEYSGMLAETFGEQSRFATDARYYAGNHASVTKLLSHVPYYKLGDFEGGEPDCLVTVRAGELDLRRTDVVLRLMVLEWMDRRRLRDDLASTLVITAAPYPSAGTLPDGPRESGR